MYEAEDTVHGPLRAHGESRAVDCQRLAACLYLLVAEHHREAVVLAEALHLIVDSVQPAPVLAACLSQLGVFVALCELETAEDRAVVIELVLTPVASDTNL